MTTADARPVVSCLRWLDSWRVAYIAKQLGHGAALSMRTYQHVLDGLED